MNKVLFILAAAILLLCAFSCSEKEQFEKPDVCQRIEGVWRGVTYPENWYSFSDGTAWTKVIRYGVVIYQNDYAYGCQGDTLNTLDVVTGRRYSGVVIFPTDSTAVLWDVFRIEIKRVK